MRHVVKVPIRAPNSKLVGGTKVINFVAAFLIRTSTVASVDCTPINDKASAYFRQASLHQAKPDVNPICMLNVEVESIYCCLDHPTSLFNPPASHLSAN